MSNERPIKKPGRSGAAFRSGPMVENPGKMLGRLMGYIFKNYRIHIIVVVIGIVVSVLANVQGTMFMKTLIDQYIMPMLQSETPDFHPLAMAILRVACFYAIGVACTYTYNRLMIYVSQGTAAETTRVPALVGLPVEKAKELIEKAGLSTGSATAARHRAMTDSGLPHCLPVSLPFCQKMAT